MMPAFLYVIEVVTVEFVVCVSGTGTEPPMLITASLPCSVVMFGRAKTFALPSVTSAAIFAR